MQHIHDDMEALRQRLKAIGPEAVRRALDDPDRQIVLTQLVLTEDMEKFARKWLDDAVRERRRDRLIKFMMVVAALEFGISVGNILGSALSV